MRLICPHCMSGVTVSDDAAGKEAVCPVCGKSFPTPTRYSAAVVPEAPVPPRPPEPARPNLHPELPPMSSAVPPPVPPAPPGLVPPAPAPSGFLPPAAPAGVVAPAGYTRSFGITVSPHVVAWLPALLLLLTFAFTCFPWVGSYVGGSAVYAQRPWGAAFGSVSRNFGLERVLPIPAEWLDKVRSDWELMVPYLLVLLLAVGLAWADRGLRAFDPRNIPPLAKVWPHRQTAVGVLATVALVLSLLQVTNGFGMERAIRKQVNEEFAAKREQAASSPAKQQGLEYDMDQAYGKFNLERTTWMDLALICNLLAVLAVLVRLVLERRGNKPPPKFLLHY